MLRRIIFAGQKCQVSADDKRGLLYAQTYTGRYLMSLSCSSSSSANPLLIIIMDVIIQQILSE